MVCVKIDHGFSIMIMFNKKLLPFSFLGGPLRQNV